MEEDPSAPSYTLSPETEKLIRSNDPPLESQANEISEILKVAKNCKATLELEIEEVQSRLLRLQRADENIARNNCPLQLGAACGSAPSSGDPVMYLSFLLPDRSQGLQIRKSKEYLETRPHL